MNIIWADSSSELRKTLFQRTLGSFSIKEPPRLCKISTKQASQNSSHPSHKLKILLHNHESQAFALYSQVPIDAPTGPTFTVFPNLPLELQRKIWEFAATTHPRVIEVHSRNKVNKYKRMPYFLIDLVLGPSHRYYTTTSPISTNLLHTCRESRNIALAKHSFHTFLGRPFYFDTLRDILWMKTNAKFDAVTLRVGNNMYGQLDRQYKENCPSAMITKHQFRFLALSYEFWVKSPEVRRRYCELEGIWDHYAHGVTTVEKIFLVYTEQDQRDEAVKDAKAIYDHGISEMKFYSEVVIDSSVPDREYLKGIQLRRRYGLGFDVPPVEAILETDLKLIQ
ncbi:9e9a9dca-1de8-4eef-a7d5-380e7d8dad4a [Sclerotinia trifoliorum]|uniref:9e9a9dca-1de8-4eef-a7d5-380e7d8dad4a n=1 Tax=Sclerotinia trifoliorum TaxID=28548 RepID=A0A8H2VXI0_9HELO|nr:9e9a9dca-1de8-4eef-a7d5-380e7d8dad4a [Sclerotinia trifoliorum]